MLSYPEQKKVMVKSFTGLLIIITSLLAIAVSDIQANPSAVNGKLTESEISQQMQNLPGWTVKNQELVRTFEFKNFVESINFVNKLVEPAEKAGHHPDIEISYNKVTIKLTTHDLGGITQQDFDLAKIISRLN